MKPPAKKKRVRQILQSVIEQEYLLFVDLFAGSGGFTHEKWVEGGLYAWRYGITAIPMGRLGGGA